jgi:hypothetical protein
VKRTREQRQPTAAPREQGGVSHDEDIHELADFLWSVASAQWSVASGQWSVASGQWSVVSGQWSVVSNTPRSRSDRSHGVRHNRCTLTRVCIFERVGGAA